MNRKVLIGAAIGLVVLLLILLLAAVTLSGKNKKKKGGPIGDQVTLSYWRVDDDESQMSQFIKDYQKTHGNIKIEYKKLARDTYEQQLVDALAAGKGPDLFEIHESWLPRYLDKIGPMPENILSVDDYRSQFFKVITDGTIVNNRIYGVPYYLDTLGLFYNNRLLSGAFLSDPPKTWQAVNGAEPDTSLLGKPGSPAGDWILTKLTKRRGATIDQSAIALGNTKIPRAADVLSLMMLQNLTQMTNANHDKATFNLPQKVSGQDKHLGTDALNLYSCFARTNCQPNYYTWNAGLGDGLHAFTSGKVAMLIGYPYQKAQIEKLNPDLQFGVAPMLQIGGQDPVNFGSFWPEVVSKSSSHQTEAWDFIKFLSGKDELSSYLDATQRVSPRKDIPGLGQFDAFYKQNESAVTWYKGDAAKADQIFAEMITRVLNGEDPQKAIDSAADQETNILINLKQNSGQPK